MPMTENEMRLVSACTEVLQCLAKGESAPPIDPLDCGDVCSETASLCEAVSLFVASYCEMQKFLRDLSAGTLMRCAPVRNQFFAPFKDLQANLRHLVWQTKQIASGDLSQQVDFFGDFSVSFNSMIESLREKRRVEAELKSLNEKLNATVQQLQDANNELESFSYSVSHDLRAPLRHMSGFATILKEKIASSHADDEAHRYASIIDEAASRMQTLIDGLLAFSQLGRVEIKNMTISMDSLVQDARNELQGQMIARDIDWKIEALPDVKGDPTLLGLVVANLISNAVKFTRRCPKAVIEIGCTDSDREHLFHVRDNGVGFDMNFADRLFSVFQRLHPQQDFEGTGIGLANVKRIISRHGGRVWAEGTPGGGAAFYFTLPISPKNDGPRIA
jgi:signal transduction histidine kinase